MHLINVDTFRREEFYRTEVPKYLILSHTWEHDEVSFQDFHHPDTAHKRGFAKIREACARTRELGYRYIWIDTCCIDKTSSAELSEAINSMFRYYEEAERCLAYLSDVAPGVDVADMSSARWFTRGWTLQELLAPRHVTFYASDWSQIGTRDELSNCISRITGINEIYLHNGLQPITRSTFLQQASVAERMAWAAQRQTTREEDVAYCLLGIFAINMPLIYGEGPGAFMRLQEQIIKRYSDPSLLAWNVLRDKLPLPLEETSNYAGGSFAWHLARARQAQLQATRSRKRGSRHAEPPTPFLAPSPRYFAGCEDIVTLNVPFNWDLTSRGIRLCLPTTSHSPPHVILPCCWRHDPDRLLAVPIHYDRVSERYSRSFAPLGKVLRGHWYMRRPRALLLKARRHAPAGGLDRAPLEQDSLLLRFRPPTVRICGLFSGTQWLPYQVRAKSEPNRRYPSVLLKHAPDGLLLEHTRLKLRFALVVAQGPRCILSADTTTATMKTLTETPADHFLPNWLETPSVVFQASAKFDYLLGKPVVSVDLEQFNPSMVMVKPRGKRLLYTVPALVCLTILCLGMHD